MKYLIVDCETEGLLDSLTEVHSLVIENGVAFIGVGADHVFHKGYGLLGWVQTAFGIES